MATCASSLRSNKFWNLFTVGQWNSNIKEAVKLGNGNRALLLFRQMKQQGFAPDNLTFPFLAKACAMMSNLPYCEMMHTQVVKSPFWSDKFVQTAMVDMYVKSKRLDYAYNMFAAMPERDIASWNIMLSGFTQFGVCERASNLFQELRLFGIDPDSVTIIALTHLILHTKNLKAMKAIHSIGIQIGLEHDVSVANTWISAYAKCSDLQSAELIFRKIEMHFRTTISWNSIIAAYASFKTSFEAVNLYNLLCYNEFRPDKSTFLSLLSSFVKPNTLCQGKLIHSHIIQTGFHLDITITNTLISMYSKCEDIYSARYLFDKMLDRTCVSWNAMIGGYAENGDVAEAFTLFDAMEKDGERADLVTVLSLLSGCGLAGALDLGKQVHDYTILKGLKDNVIVSNALIDMYFKCGSISDALEIFLTSPDKTVVTWTTMVVGFALNGESKQALYYFNQMIELGHKPNHVTFLSVLQACAHAGFLEKGFECFNLMTKEYKITPKLDHYSCMADLLGRKGKIVEALDFIQNMPIKPDAGIWGSLLFACKIHRKIKIGEYVANRLFELEPQVAAPYVEMANMYASLGRWNGVAMIRTIMKAKRVRKSPGKSIVQVDGKAHEFMVEDRCHDEGLLTYHLLDGLLLQLKEERSLLAEALECEFG